MQIDKYKGSTEKAAELIENYKEEFYNLAISYVENKDWKQAQSLLEKLGDYKDTHFFLTSAKKIIQSEEIKKELEKNQPKEPAIGMTAEQVEKSTWGKPKDINKTTFSWGVKEQWVYSG